MTASMLREFSPKATKLHASNLFKQLTRLVGQDLYSDLDIAKAVEIGVSPEMIDRLASEGLTRRELEFVIPSRTLSHRIHNGQRLTMDESERSVRVAKLLLLAEALFGDKAAATAWLRQPMRRFEGKSPLDMAHTEPGARLVEQLIAQANEGYAA